MLFHMFLNITIQKNCNFPYFSQVFSYGFNTTILKKLQFPIFLQAFSYFFNITDPDLLPPKSFEDLKLTPHDYLGSLRFSGGFNRKIGAIKVEVMWNTRSSHYHGSVKHASLQYVRSFLEKIGVVFQFHDCGRKGYLILLRKDHTYSWNICDIIHPVMDLVQVSSIFHLELDCCGSELT